jgi:recombination protein RecT
MSQAVATNEARKDVAPPKEERIKSLIASPAIRARFDEMLGRRAPAFLSSIVSAVSSNPALAQCEPMSVISAAAVAAAMDLPINSSLGFAHIVPYKNVAQFQIGWKGFVQLAMRSGQYKTINLTPVLEGQIKNHNPFTGDMEFVQESKSEKQIGYLLYFKLLNSYEKYFYMTREEVEAHGKEYSATFKRGFGMWVDNFEAMALKTVAKLGLSRYGILSVDMQRAVELDQAAIDDNGQPQYIDAEFRAASAPEPSRADKMNQAAPAAPTPQPAAQAAAPAEAKSSDPESFDNFTGSLFAAEKPAETMATVQVEVARLVLALKMDKEGFPDYVQKVVGKGLNALALADVQKLRDQLKLDLEKKAVK